MVQNRRFCVCVEEPTRQLLASFESILKAKRDVEDARRVLLAGQVDGMASVAVSRKRSFDCRLDSLSNGDHSMDVDEDNDDHVPERQPSAPFRDR
jgi:hypothetical protein